MSLSTTVFLPPTTYGTPSGNYNGTESAFLGDPIPAASFYGGQGSVQTARVTTTGFVGRITFQATLSSLHQQAAWFDLATVGDATTPLTTTTAVNLVGNFVWLRVAVTEFSGGRVDSATLIF